MDRHFLEFWGNYLLSVARGQKQLEDISRWIDQGFKSTDEMTTMFKNYYGLDDYDRGNPENTTAWEKATVEFKKSFVDTFRIMGWVSNEEHQALEEENRALKNRITEQDQTIQRLKSLLSQPVIDQNQTLNVLQDLIQKQGEEFQRLMTNLSTTTKNNSDS